MGTVRICPSYFWKIDYNQFQSGGQIMPTTFGCSHLIWKSSAKTVCNEVMHSINGQNYSASVIFGNWGGQWAPHYTYGIHRCRCPLSLVTGQELARMDLYVVLLASSQSCLSKNWPDISTRRVCKIPSTVLLTPPIAEIICVKNVGAFVVVGS